MRDTQQAAVYSAEHLVQRILSRSAEFPTVQVAGSTITLPPEKRFGSLTAVQAYVDAVLALNWVRATWPRAALPIRVRARAGDRQAVYRNGVIAVPSDTIGSSWALRELVVLHEITHHLITGAEAAHGPTFVRTLIELVTEIVGPEAGLLLRVTMHDCGVSAR